mmetsp:Transcript_69117/g.136690  ORF Transcript_69117/g.136690 Transcript_69117/m.136690 type:complete len:327 (-) Transcript_69117:457-1437(-)
MSAACVHHQRFQPGKHKVTTFTTTGYCESFPRPLLPIANKKCGDRPLVVGKRLRSPLDLRTALHNEDAVLRIHATLNVLRCASKCCFHLAANISESLQEVLAVAWISDELQTVKFDHAGNVGLGADGLEKASTSKTLQVLTVAIRAEDQTLLRPKPRALAEERTHNWCLVPLGSEAQRPSGTVADERLPTARNHLAVDLVRIVGEWVLRVEHECVLGWQQLLHQNSHVEVVETPAGFRQGHPGAQSKQRGPDFFSCIPSLLPVIQFTEAALAALTANTLHGTLQLPSELCWNGEFLNQNLSLLKDAFCFSIAGGGVQPLQQFFQFR